MAVQTVVVGALTIVVFVTLLRPEDNRPLSSIEAPGGGPLTSLPGPDVYTADRHHGGHRHAPHPPPHPAAGPPSPPAAPPAPPPSGGEVPSPPPAGPSHGEGTPSEDQYADTLTRLEARLN